MFRNARFYRLTGDWPASEDDLSLKLSAGGFVPCAPLVERSSGWVAVQPDGEGAFARRINGADLLKLRTQSRVLPAAAINEALEERVEEFRSRMDQEPSRREKRRLKAEIKDELMSKALVKSERIWGYADYKSKLLIVDAAQEAKAERFLRHLRLAFESLDIQPLKFKQPVGRLLTKLFLGELPAHFAIGQECRMQDAANSRATVRWNHFDLTDASIRGHVADGMHLTHLAIEYDHALSFVLDENGTLTKLSLIGMADDENKDEEPLALQDTEFALLSGLLRQFVDDLKGQLDGFA